MEKIWPNVPQTNPSRNEIDVEDDANILGMLRNVEGGTEIQLEDVAEWIQGDEDPHPTMTEDDIVASCSSQQAAELSSDDDDPDDSVDEKKGPNHTEATRMLDEVMVYLEQQDETSPTEMLLIKRLRDRAAKKRSSNLKQKKISSFFSTVL